MSRSPLTDGKTSSERSSKNGPHPVQRILFVIDCATSCWWDLFLETVFSPADGSVTTDSCYTILTTTVPRYACWLVCVQLKSCFVFSF